MQEYIPQTTKSQILSGRQNVVMGDIQGGDVLVFGPGEYDWTWAIHCCGNPVDSLDAGWRVYRTMPVAKQGDLDHVRAAEQTLRVQPEPEPDRQKARTDDANKPPMAMLPPELLRQVAMVQAYGHKKYSDFHNYRKGMEVSRNLSCAIRHIMAYMDGEDNDAESGVSHLAHASCRLGFVLQNLKDGTAIDDRFKR